MRCIRPLKASQNAAGDIVYSSKQAIPGLVEFQFECRKCLPCRLNLAREKAVRCLHEAKMVEKSMFLTLTYDDEHLDSPVLQYRDFQLFMKSLRNETANKINYMVTGEYGEKFKRPHWHAIVFGFCPDDAKHKYTSDRGDTVWKSDQIDRVWKRGATEFGKVTIDSAGYVARYAAKKLVHGKDQDHIYHPIHRVSSKRAIGRSWIEKNYAHTFLNGYINLPNGSECKIPRYYVDWCKKHKPFLYERYVTEVLPDIIKQAEWKERKEELHFMMTNGLYSGGNGYPELRKNVKLRCLERKFKRLQSNLKGDI